MGHPEACGDTTEQPTDLDHRLLLAYRRYDLAYSHARPGTLSAAQLAEARLELAAVLQEAGQELPEDVLVQIRSDADSVRRTGRGRASPPK